MSYSKVSASPVLSHRKDSRGIVLKLLLYGIFFYSCFYSVLDLIVQLNNPVLQQRMQFIFPSFTCFVNDSAFLSHIYFFKGDTRERIKKYIFVEAHELDWKFLSVKIKPKEFGAFITPSTASIENSTAKNELGTDSNLEASKRKEFERLSKTVYSLQAFYYQVKNGLYNAIPSANSSTGRLKGERIETKVEQIYTYTKEEGKKHLWFIMHRIDNEMNNREGRGKSMEKVLYFASEDFVSWECLYCSNTNTTYYTLEANFVSASDDLYSKDIRQNGKDNYFPNYFDIATRLFLYEGNLQNALYFSNVQYHKGIMNCNFKDGRRGLSTLQESDTVSNDNNAGKDITKDGFLCNIFDKDKEIFHHIFHVILVLISGDYFCIQELYSMFINSYKCFTTENGFDDLKISQNSLEVDNSLKNFILNEQGQPILIECENFR